MEAALNERALVVAILLSGLIAAKPEAVDDPIEMGKLIAKAFKLAADIGANQ